MDQAHAAVALTVVLTAATGCGGSEGTMQDNLTLAPALYASELVEFRPGAGAGFGADAMPEVVLGAPVPSAEGGGSLDVISLGVGGEIVLGFGARTIIDGPGPDFVVFENAFVIDGSGGAVFAELGEVSVSADGVDWHAYPCEADAPTATCAGQTPTLAFDPVLADPLDPDRSGGDGFDLADLGLTEARYVRIRDLATAGEAPSAGFDLDAVGLVHLR